VEGETKNEQVQKYELEVKELEKWVSELTDCDVDISQVYDSSLSFGENQEKLKKEVKRIEGISNAQKEVNRYSKELEYEPNEVLDKHYKGVRNSIEKICKGYSNLAFIKGRGGIGKSLQIERYLKEFKAKAIPSEYLNNKKLNAPILEELVEGENYYLEVTGELSEAYLYRILYVFNGTIIWFRDVNKLLKTLRNIDTLKAATESKSKRLICNNNYSVRSADIPRQFIYTGRVIFDFNSLEGIGLKEDFEALRTRGDYIEIALSRDDIEEVMNSIAKADWQKKVTEHLIENYNTTGWDLLNLRTQWKAFKTYKFCENTDKDWKKEIKYELNHNMSKIRCMLYSLIGRNPTKSIELKRLLLQKGEVNSLRTAHRRVEEWLEIGELYKVSSEEKNYLVCIDYINHSS